MANGNEEQLLEKSLSFPYLKLFLILALPLMFLYWHIASSQASFTQTQELSQLNLELVTLKEQVKYLDEVLTMSTYMSVYNQSRHWQQRYLNGLDDMDTTLEKVMALGSEQLRQQFYASTFEANEKLVEIEKQAFRLASEGELKEAEALLESDTYLSNKTRFAEGIEFITEQITQQVEQVHQEHIDSTKQRITWSIWGGSVLAIAVFLLFLDIVRWRKITRQSTQALHDQQQQTTLELEAKVQERTQQLKEQNRDLETAKQTAEKATEAKSNFLSIISHELRTPLNGIMGMASILRTTELKENQINFLDSLEASGQALTVIISDILDFTNIEFNEIQLEKDNVEVKVVMRNIATVFTPFCEGKDLTFTQNISDEVPNYIYTDPTRLRQVLNNITSNAFKFTERGSIEVNALVRDDSFVFQIKDTGAGISADKLTQVFEGFSQEDSTMSRRHDGLGLGLTIAMRLVDMMGGKIAVESTLGKGTCFEMRFPLDEIAVKSESFQIST